MHTGRSVMSESISPLRGGTQASSLQARAEILKDAFARDWLHFSLDNLSVSSLRLFQPSALDVSVSRTIKFGDQGTDQLGLVFETQGPNLGLNFSDSSRHGNPQYFSLASSRMHIRRQKLAGEFKRRDGLLSRYRRKRFQEIVERVSRFKIVEEVLRGNPSADKDGHAALDVRIAVNHGLLHAMASSIVEMRMIHLGL